MRGPKRKLKSQKLRGEPRRFKLDCVCSCQSAEDSRRIILEPKWLRTLSSSSVVVLENLWVEPAGRCGAPGRQA